mmetsp:Transcript_24166/g.48201  ORF Transcript_24166/g.48201 Transcript_24166/m.48201 type:complete len:100 (-) Transcript_24166:234-533(-)|eukprot:CAMPEP_0171639820 /NCGR_PEP_ID=MMETSP0990-20121206/29986_1 /TAXON_ID=483369 /ORGANISM="non described non described, Strain CCMP2098" /LENGTH=99 /DNA_ID=CAMNT_0012213721 /DNA_START=53 /DNA_END=352 /DNA_ORIENTATION=-
MARFSMLIASLCLAVTAAFVPLSRPIVKGALQAEPTRETESRADFLKSALVAGAGIFAAAPNALALTASNPAAWQGKGPNAKKAKGKYKTGNIGSIMKR